MKYILIIFSILLLPFITLNAQESNTFNMPDVRNDYCGVYMNYQYCKCAFHGDYCNAIGMNESEARTHVMSQFQTWVGDQIESMARNCIDNGNNWNTNTRTCTITEEKQEDSKTESLEEQYNLPNMTGVPEPTKTGYYGKVSKADGEVFVYQWSFGRWVRAIPGMPLYQGDFVKTLNGNTRLIYNGQFGEDVLNLATETILETGRPGPALRPASEFSLLGVVRDGVVDVYNTLQEAVSTEEKVPAWYIQLHSPNVSTGRRGTHYSLAYNQDTNESIVTVYEGEVDVATSSSGMVVSMIAGEQVSVSGDFATSTITDNESHLSSVGLPTERLEATPEELTHTAPEIPVDDFAKDPGPTREELVGDLSDIEEQFASNNSIIWIITLLLLIGAGGVWYINTKNDS